MKGGIFMAMVISKSNFEDEVVKSEVPVLVDFWAPWCGPCRAVGPVIDEIANEADGYKVGKVNVDEEGDLAAQFGVMSIPTIVVFKNGTVYKKTVGAASKEQILDLFN